MFELLPRSFLSDVTLTKRNLENNVSACILQIYTPKQFIYKGPDLIRPPSRVGHIQSNIVSAPLREGGLGRES